MANNMKKYLLLSFLALALAVAGTAYADFSPSEWQYKKPVIAVPTVGSSKYVRVSLDREVSFGARTDLADLRVVTSGGEEVPYQLVIENEAVRREYVQSSLRDLAVKDGETMFILDLGKSGTIHDHLVIETGSKNFKRPVSVYASNTANDPYGNADTRANTDKSIAEWALLSNTSFVYNYYDQSLGFDAGSKDVYYPESTSRYLRVVIGRGEGSDVAVAGARVLRILQRDARKNQMVERAAVAQNAKEKSTEVAVDLGGAGIATRKVILATDDTHNFNRRVVIQGSNDAATWKILGQGYVFSLKTPLFSGSDLSVSYPETEMRHIRVIVFDQDDKPINWKSILTLEGVARSIVFASKFGTEEVLYYGNARASEPLYDIARFFHYFEGVSLTEFTLGTQQLNAAYVPPAPPVVPFTERNKNVLNGALVLLVALVSFLLVAYLKKLKLAKPHQ